MNMHALFGNAALLASIGIALQSLEALLIPVWAIVVLMAALPTVVIFASVMCPGALAATVFGRYTRRLGLTVEGFVTMLTDKFLRMIFHRGKIASTAAIEPDRSRGTSIKSEYLAALLAGKFNEWVYPLRAGLVPARVVLSSVMRLKTGSAAVLARGQGRAAYLAMEHFAAMITGKFARKPFRRLVCATTGRTAISANGPRGICLETKRLTAMLTNGCCWGLFRADDSTSGMLQDLKSGHTSRRWCLSVVS